MSTAVKIENTSVTLDGGLKALDNINLELPSGKMIGFIGPSGAGKTTLIRLIVGSLPFASEGTVTVLNLPAGSKELRNVISYMSQELSVYTDLTVSENLTYFITMSGIPKKELKKNLDKILEQVDLVDKRDTLVSNLSGGQKQRVSLAITLIGKPKILVLDEPTVGLDPVLRENLWNMFSELAKAGITLIISSHSMDEASRCDNLVLLREGKIVAHDTPRALLEQTNSKTIEECFLKLVEYKK